jgi:hypothetical protein
MKLITTPITKVELKKMADSFGGLVKAVVDVKKEIMVVDAPMHADEEKELLEAESNQDDLWGINLYPELPSEDFIEFDSMINLRPNLNNMSRVIESEKLRNKIIKIISKLVI